MIAAARLVWDMGAVLWHLGTIEYSDIVLSVGTGPYGGIYCKT